MSLTTWLDQRRLALARRLLAGLPYTVRRKERRTDDPCAPPPGCLLQAEIDAEPHWTAPEPEHSFTFDPEDALRWLRAHPCKHPIYPPEDRP